MKKVSICCATYNHERYIAKTIESFLCQKADFDFEIIISDDHSTDNTPLILKEYEEKYPDKIRILLNTKNLGPLNNLIQVLKAAESEYIAYSDGDDYWQDEYKLTKQVNALEINKCCSFSFHDVDVVNEKGDLLHKLSKGRITEKLNDGMIKASDVIGAPIRIVHANALLFKKELLGDFSFLYKFKDTPMGDYILTVLLASNGDAYYFKSSSAAYRILSTSMSHTRRLKDGLFEKMIALYKKLDEHFEFKYKNEFKRALNGHKIMMFEEGIKESKENKSYTKLALYYFKMLLYCKNSQLSYRDILWLVKTDLKEISKTRFVK